MSSVDTCPICDSRFQPDPVETWTRYRLLQCPNCQLQLWDPPEGGDAAWYDTSDHYLAMPVVDWLGWYHRWALEHLPAEVKTLLDIGCADGRFVYAAAARGIDAFGTDHSSQLIELGNQRHRGVRLSQVSIQQMDAAGRTYDAVTLFEVIEHVPDPLALVKAASALLKPGGILITSTPNRLGRPKPPAALDRPPHHLTRWTPEALREAVRRGGFTPVELGLSPGRVGLLGFLLDKIRFGLMVKLLRRKARASHCTPNPGQPGPGNRRIRNLILLKERIFAVLTALLVPFIGWAFRGGSMVLVSRRDG